MGREIDVLAQPMRAKNRARSWLARTPCVNGTLNLTRVYRDRHFEPDPSAFCHVPACGDNVVRSYPLSFPSNCGVALAPDGGLVCRAILHAALPKLVVPHVFLPECHTRAHKRYCSRKHNRGFRSWRTVSSFTGNIGYISSVLPAWYGSGAFYICRIEVAGRGSALRSTKVLR